MNQIIKTRIEQINSGQVPEGFIKTKYGTFADDWKMNVPLDKLGKWSKGKGIPGDKLGAGDVPCIGYGDIYMKYNVHFEEAESTTDETTANESNRFNKGVLFFTGTGETPEEIGKCVCYNGDNDIYAGGDIIAFNSSKVNAMFLAYQQNQWWQIKQKYRLAQGHSVVHIHKEDLQTLLQAYPDDVDMQKRIVNILTVWDERVRLQEEYIAKLERRKDALMQKLLTGNTRLNGYTGLWREYMLAELGEITGAGVDKKINPGEQPVTLLNFKNVYNQTYIKRSDLNHVVTASKNKVNKCSVLKYDVFITPTSETADDIAYTAVAIENMPNVVYSYHVNRLRPNELVNGFYLNFAMGTQYFRKQAIEIAEGAGIRYVINLSKLKGLKVLMPTSLEEQNAIVDILSTADKQIELEKKKLELLKRQQKSMQQLLLTGIVRV